jgi:hypothetical protein
LWTLYLMNWVWFCNYNEMYLRCTFSQNWSCFSHILRYLQLFIIYYFGSSNIPVILWNYTFCSLLKRFIVCSFS